MKLTWDAVGSEFGGCPLQYEMFYSGAEHVTRDYTFRNFEFDYCKGLVERFMSRYDLE